MKQLKFTLSLMVWLSVSAAMAQQMADKDFDYPIKNPAYETGKGSVITLDEAHFNFHTLSGRYLPFGQLLQKDGFVLKSGKEPFSVSSLSETKILVIANALADTLPWKLPAKTAFAKEEINALVKWVSGGGSLFLIADHMPFACCAAELAAAFGFNFIDGFAMRRDKKPEVFSVKKNNLSANKITAGANESEQIESLMFFTGQAFIAPKEATVVTTLDDDYEVLLPSAAWEFKDNTPRMSGQGLVNGAFMAFGKGRLVVMGEAAMFSAQVSGPQKNKAGMNHPDARQNPQFLLNIIHWLDGRL